MEKKKTVRVYLNMPRKNDDPVVDCREVEVERNKDWNRSAKTAASYLMFGCYAQYTFQYMRVENI